MHETAAPRVPPLAGRHGWIITDDKAGNEAQCLGVAQALGLACEVKRVAPRGLYRLLAPYGPLDPTQRPGRSSSPFVPPWPEIAIACGRLATPAIRAVRRASGGKTFTVVLLDPKVGLGAADLFWVPEHDRLRGANVITTATAPHRYSPNLIAELRRVVPPEIATLPRPRIAVLVGGPNRDFGFTGVDGARLAGLLAGMAGAGAGLMISFSRRTPREVADAIEAATQGMARLIYRPGDAGPNPFAQYLAQADVFVVTADSVNMTGEACVTGRPVHVFEVSGRSAKFERFHARLTALGATRPLRKVADIHETWTYPPIYSADEIAAEIARRYLERAP